MKNHLTGFFFSIFVHTFIFAGLYSGTIQGYFQTSKEQINTTLGGSPLLLSMDQFYITVATKTYQTAPAENKMETKKEIMEQPLPTPEQNQLVSATVTTKSKPPLNPVTEPKIEQEESQKPEIIKTKPEIQNEKEEIPQWLVMAQPDDTKNKTAIDYNSIKDKISGFREHSSIHEGTVSTIPDIESASFIAFTNGKVTNQGNGKGTTSNHGNAVSGEGTGNEKKLPNPKNVYKQKLRAQIGYYKKYPRRARRMGQEGNCIIKFMIFPDGSVKQIQMLHSSGYKLLDQAALKAIHSVNPFIPYSEDVSSSPMEFEIPVKFTLS
jgi:protein TonB